MTIENPQTIRPYPLSVFKTSRFAALAVLHGGFRTVP
jgi:hypothetical protein